LENALAPWHQLPQSIHSLVAENPNSVLLQTARFDAANHTSYLYLNPLEVLSAQSLEDLPNLFIQLEAALAQGHHAAGYLSYECGYHFEPHTITNPLHQEPADTPLAWFGIYSAPITFDHATGLFSQEPPPHHISTPSTQPFADHVTLTIDETTYSRQILKIKDLIAAGDTYQVNFTDRLSIRTELPPAAAFTTLIGQQPVSYAAFLNISGCHILSLSPELFFHLGDDKIITRPMKGTMPRGRDLEEDTLTALSLQHDEKNRSEHVMIVDLLRNDLGRICRLGSVHVEDLFTVERYETLHQMTSTVAGTLRPGLTFYDIFRALFPCGSITGAPKIRTMQIIRELEAQPRGIYTGAIGHIAPSLPGKPRTATFNVAIRTLTLNNGQAEMGVGGGIVADSEPEAEYRECLLKASFLTHTPNDFQLIETILWSPRNPSNPSNQSSSNESPFYLLGLHLDRLEASAAYFKFPYNRARITTELEAFTKTFSEAAPHRIRLLLHPDGHTSITAAPFTPGKPSGRVCIALVTTSSSDLFLRHKTTRRALYDQQYKRAVAEGFDEVLFLNERGELTEGAISNLFLSKDGKLLTPPLTSGVLPGIYRRHVLETHSNAQEKVLTLEDLDSADAIYICNSIRGMNEVKLHALATTAP
jgi:para-aminobenzoate synthetase / 4-amino-4-deoxychorismate lyase